MPWWGQCSRRGDMDSSDRDNRSPSARQVVSVLEGCRAERMGAQGAGRSGSPDSTLAASPAALVLKPCLLLLLIVYILSISFCF